MTRSVEAEFRVDALAADRRVATGLTLVAIAFLFLTFPHAQAFGADVTRLHQAWSIHALVVTIAAAAALGMRRATTPDSYDTVMTWWIATWFAGIVAENALLPADLTSFVAWDVFLTVAVYAAAPLALARQAWLAALLGVGDVLVLWTLKTPSASFDVVDVTIAYTCANVVGVFVSCERHRWRRRAFVALRHELALRKELEAAQLEVKILQGILPICSFCKNIRTDAGDWQDIEAYVHAHSEAEFSHGVCPECMATHYPGLTLSR